MFDFLDKNKAGQQKQAVEVRRQPILEPLVKLQGVSQAYGNLSLAQLVNERENQWPLRAARYQEIPGRQLTGIESFDLRP